MDGLYGDPQDLNLNRLSEDIRFVSRELYDWWHNISGTIEEQAKELVEILTVADAYDVTFTEGLFPLMEHRLDIQGNRLDKALTARYYILAVLLLGPSHDPEYISVVQEMRRTWDGYPSSRGTDDY